MSPDKQVKEKKCNDICSRDTSGKYYRLCKQVQITLVVECPLQEREFGRASALGAGGRRFKTRLCRVGGLKLPAVLSSGFNQCTTLCRKPLRRKAILQKRHLAEKTLRRKVCRISAKMPKK